MFLEITKKELFENTQVSFNFEFYSPLKKNELAAKFARNLGKKVSWFTKMNEEMTPTSEVFKLSPTVSSKFNSVSLSTGLIPYHEAIHIMLKSMNIIETVGFAMETSKVTCKISINEEELGIPNIKNLNILKYLVSINEENLLDKWNGDRKVNRSRLPYIHPKNMFTTVLKSGMVERINHMELNFPESDFFATDFSELGEGKMIIRYIGGKEYYSKKNDAVETINLVIENLYDSLANGESYTLSESRKIEEMFSKYTKAINSTKSYSNFKKDFPEIDVYVDLRSDKFLIESNYNSIRNDLFKLVAYGNVTEGVINYDKGRGILQVKGTDITRGAIFENLEFFGCTLTIDAKNCLFDNCVLESSKLTGCRLHTTNFINDSKIVECSYSSASNKFENSYISNTSEALMKGEFNKCLIVGGKVSIDSQVDKSCKFIAG